MSTWRRGRFALSAAEGGELSLEAFVQDVERFKPLRVGGNAVFLTSKPGIVPKVLLHHLCHKGIHAALKEAELARGFATPEALRAHPRLARFVAWVRRRPPHFLSRVPKARGRR